MMISTAMVFVIDDDASVRKSLKRLLDAACYKVELFTSASEFLSRSTHDGPSCVVVDVRMPELNGIDFQKALIEGGREEQLVFITGHGDVPMSVKAMKAGAAEFLTKPFRPQDLLDAIRSALDRDRVTRRAREELAELRRWYATLTPRERDVMAGVVAGLLNKQIAAELGTSEATVKEQRGHLMQKMRAGSVAELVRFAGLLGIPPTESGPARPASQARN